MTSPITPITPAEVFSIVARSRRCTEATLLAFGIQAIPQFGSGCLEYLRANGRTLTQLNLPRDCTIKQFYYKVANPNKNYLIFTAGHAMALRGRHLIDTANLGIDKRKIEFAWEVSYNATT